MLMGEQGERRGLGQKGAEELSIGLGQAWKVGAGRAAQ